MESQFFEKPILNSPYDYPARHWELDENGQPTQRVLPIRRTAEFFTPMPKPRKRKGKAEQLAWSTLNSDTSRSFPKPASGRIAVKVINHLGDEVMKVFRVA